MKYLLTAVLAFTIILNGICQNDPKAKQLFNQGIEQMDKGEIEKALEFFKQAQAIEPHNIAHTYEIAHCYYLTRQYKKVIPIMQPLILQKDATDHFFHLLGSSYEHSNNSKEAITVYKEGLKRFPDSGILNYALGKNELNKQHYREALTHFENGIKAEPAFSENYYWASKVHSSLEDKLWGIMYAELYINMEGINEQSKELEAMIFDVYKNGITLEGNVVTVELADADSSARNFEKEFEKNFEQSASEVKKQVSISSLYEIRKSFLTKWIATGNHDQFPNLLFEWHKTLMLKGYLEPYHYWLLKEGNEQEYQAYIAANKDLYKEFLEWLPENHLTPTKSNYFVATEYAAQ